MPQGIRIGDIILSLASDGKEKLNIDPAYLPFTSSDKPDIRIRLRHGVYQSSIGKKAFESSPIWTLLREGDKNVVEIFPDTPPLTSKLVFKRPMKEAELYLMGSGTDPFHGPAMELLMINYLAQGYGLILHACGVVREGRGLLFVGDSGAGKSTMAGLWAGEKGAEVLSDDRTIVRKKGDEFWMYGTPWHGEGKFGSPGSAKVEKIFFIGHGGENDLRDMKAVDAAARLLTCSFPPYWEHEGMAFTVGFVSELAVKVGCRELSFRPDGSVVEFLKG